MFQRSHSTVTKYNNTENPQVLLKFKAELKNVKYNFFAIILIHVIFFFKIVILAERNAAINEIRNYWPVVLGKPATVILWCIM